MRLCRTNRKERNRGSQRRQLPRLPPQSFFGVSAVFHYLGPCVRRAAVRPARRARGGLAAGSQRQALVFALAAAVAASPPADPEDRRALLGLGVVLAMMNSAFYLAVDRLPLSTVGAIEFGGRGPDGRGSADGAQCRGARAHYGGRGHHYRNPHHRPGVRAPLRVRELRVVHVVELRQPGRTRLAPRRGCGRADRQGGGGRRHHVLRHGRHLLRTA